jgi:hypothetical protein
MQKKVSLVSTNRISVKDELSVRYEKLQKGIIDDEISKIYNTALDSKNLIKKPNTNALR